MQTNQRTNENFGNINSQELNQMLKEENSLFLLDVRESFELLTFGAIPGVYNIPLGEIAERKSELPEKSNTIIVICQHGSRSYDVSNFLANEGFSNIINLADGTTGWVSNGYEVVKSKLY